MQVEKSFITGLIVITPDVFRDERGEFVETFQDKRYQDLGIPPFVQDNLSLSKHGVLRGLHYQVPPNAQGKLVQALSGKALDVAVDIRFGSPTFGKYFAVELSGENRKQLWIPTGFAHGFVSLVEGTIFSYKCTGYYSKEHERGVQPLDPDLNITWGVPQPLLAERDRQFPLLKDISRDFTFDTSAV